MSLLKTSVAYVIATLALSLSSFAQVETCNFKLLSIHSNGSANAINRSGAIVGTYDVIKGSQAYLRGFIREANGELTSYRVAGSQSTYLTGINDKGAMVGGYDYQAAAQAYGLELAGSKFVPINYPGAGITDPSGITTKGRLSEQNHVISPLRAKVFCSAKGNLPIFNFLERLPPEPVPLTTAV